MRLPRLFAVGLWLAATVGSTTIVWTATSIVAADVTDRPAPLVARRDVVSELESGSAVVGTTTSTTLKASGASPTVPAPGRVPVVTSPPAPAPPSRAPQVTLAPISTTTTAAAVAGPAPGPPPTAPPTTQPPSRPTATYSTSGGVVRVACDRFFIELISAIPSNGWSARVLAAGPGNVDVRFVRPGQELSVKAACFGQPFRYYEQDPPRQAP